MIEKSEFLRLLNVIASRRPGTFDEDTPVSLVVSPTGMTPRIFSIFLFQEFGEPAKHLSSEDFRGGAMTMGEIYERLAAEQPADA